MMQTSSLRGYFSNVLFVDINSSKATTTSDSKPQRQTSKRVPVDNKSEKEEKTGNVEELSSLERDINRPSRSAGHTTQTSNNSSVVTTSAMSPSEMNIIRDYYFEESDIEDDEFENTKTSLDKEENEEYMLNSFMTNQFSDISPVIGIDAVTENHNDEDHDNDEYEPSVSENSSAGSQTVQGGNIENSAEEVLRKSTSTNSNEDSGIGSGRSKRESSSSVRSRTPGEVDLGDVDTAAFFNL